MDDSSTSRGHTPSPHPRFAYLMLKRATPSFNRQPIIAENPPRDSDWTPEKAHFAKMMWGGAVGATQDGLQEWIDSGRDVGVFTGQSGLVVIDCDVKHYEEEKSIETDGNTARFVTTQESHTEYGIQDLEREVLRLGHTMDELQTYTVKSKSDGRHLYFWQNPEAGEPLASQVQREAWHVDVKASVNTWVAAPPSANYEVLDDREPAVLPLWLDQFLRHELQHLNPIGGRRTRGLMQRAKRLNDERFAPGLTATQRTGLMHDWAACWLQLIADAQKLDRGWNNAVNDVSFQLFLAGWTREAVIAAIEDVAAPRTTRDRNAMLQTIRSAQRGARRELSK